MQRVPFKKSIKSLKEYGMCGKCGYYFDDKGNCWRCIHASAKTLEKKLIETLSEEQKALFLAYKETMARMASLVIFTPLEKER